MATWMANWIRLPIRQSNSTYRTAPNAIEPTKLIEHSLVRLAAPLPITGRQQNCVSEFNHLCEKRSSDSPCAVLDEMLIRWSEEGRQSREPFFSGRHGNGSASPGSVSRRLSFSLRSSFRTWRLCRDALEPINSWRHSS